MGDPTFCYVVMAHHPSGLPELTRRIRALSPTAHIIVRFENADDIDPAALREAGAMPLLSRIRVRWGAWSMTEAMLEAFGQARTATDASHYVLVSGQDYPVRDLAAWEQEIALDGDDAVLEPIADHPEDWQYRWSFVDFGSGPARIQRAARHLGWRLGTVTRPVLQILPRFAENDGRWLFGLARPGVEVPHGLTITKCSQWMTLSARAVDAVLATDRSDRALRQFFGTVRISDESYIQTILHHAPGLRVTHGETTVKRFPEGKASPMWLDATTLTELASASRAPFARKIPPSPDPDLIAAADALAAADRPTRSLSARRKDHEA